MKSYVDIYQATHFFVYLKRTILTFTGMTLQTRKTTKARSDQTSSIHPPSQCVNSSHSHQMKGNLHSAYCGIQITTKPYTEQSFDSASLSKNILSKPRPPQQSKIAQSLCKRFSFMVRKFYPIRPVSFHIFQKKREFGDFVIFSCRK